MSLEDGSIAINASERNPGHQKIGKKRYHHFWTRLLRWGPEGTSLAVIIKLDPWFAYSDTQKKGCGRLIV